MDLKGNLKKNELGKMQGWFQWGKDKLGLWHEIL